MLALHRQRILVTGAHGFVGGRLVAELRARGASDIAGPRSSDFDLTDPVATRALFAATRPTLVFHLAARVGGIGANRKHPGTFFRDNMAMGLNVLETARAFGTRKVVVTSTICAYPKHAPVPFREEDLWNGFPEETNAPYGVAKKALHVMASAYREEFGSNFITLFPVNLYGPGDNFDLESSHVVPAMIRKMLAARDAGMPTVELWGDGTPTREFLYVDDAARGISDAAEKYDDPDPVNLGAGFEISMEQLAAKVARATGYRGRVVWDASRPNGQPRRMLDVSRARERFGFVATTPFDEGLERTVGWYERHRKDASARTSSSQDALGGNLPLGRAS
ncbi:MAG TPA: GDP-L-fucose synthase [Polyangiaceae bacterium]|nr:GDP-L-fucose synthase [Polyangiaceae bacterium]